MATVVGNRAAEFLLRWEFENIKVVARTEWDEAAQRLAQQCREDAAKAGVSNQDLDAAVDGDLIGNMIGALSDAELRQIARDQWAD